MELKLLLLVFGALQATGAYEQYDQVYLILHDCGCWRDSPEDRAIPDADDYLDGHYMNREGAVQKCGKFAKSRGYEVFAIQDGGRCKTGPTAPDNFQKHGPSYDCSPNKRGGFLANQVYRINVDYEINYRAVGCYMDDPYHPAIPSVEKRFIRLHDDHKTRLRAIRTCAEAALGLEYKIFAIQNGGQCMTGPDAGKTYNKYGKSYECKLDGRGGYMANMVYEITEADRLTVSSFGCFKHIPGSVPSLDDKGVINQYSHSDIIEQCLRYAASLGFKTVAIVDGRCHSSKGADIAYVMNGRSESCRKDGKGGPGSAEVYDVVINKVVTVQYWGCWADDEYGTMPVAEGRTPTLSDNYKTRTLAINKCGGYAYSQGYTAFALQDGGLCCTGPDAGRTSRRIRPAENCEEDLEGGKKSNSVWMIM